MFNLAKLVKVDLIVHKDDAFQRFVDEQYRLLTPGERVRLCTEMFDAARSLAESSLPPALGEYGCKCWITERFYGAELANRIFPSDKR